MKYVIIGNSAAAIGCITGIRTIDKDSSITIICDEIYHTYSRPLISYWLNGKVSDENMYYRNLDFYIENDCTLMLGKRVKKINPNRKNLELDDKSFVTYDKLLVATGSSPFVPPIEGIDKHENVFTFLTWDSAKAIKEAVKADSKVLILGAGLIGLKAAEGLSKTCGAITIIDLADRILPSILDNEGASFVQKHIESKGIKFILNDAATKISNNTLTLKSNTTLDFDVLIVAVGVRPNVQLVKDAGGEVNRGITTNDKQETTLTDIYSAGDCVETFDISSDQTKILALLPNAYMQGEIAGLNMAGDNKSFSNAIPMNAIGFFGLHMITAGFVEGECETTINETSYKKMAFSDNLLKGFIMIGDIDRAGIYTSLIREKTPLDEIDLDILKTNPKLSMFSKEKRKEKLSGGA